jgi:hypothetical protein
MAEITYQMVLSTLQTIALIVGIIYYITIMRNTQKARRSEILWNFLQLRRQEDIMLKYAWVMSLEWEDYDDYESKYGREANPEAWAKLWSYLVQFDDIGLMVGRGVIDIADYYELASSSIPILWMKYKPIIEEIRRRGDPKTMDWLQYLVEEMHKESKRRGDNLLPELN